MGRVCNICLLKEKDNRINKIYKEGIGGRKLTLKQLMDWICQEYGEDYRVTDSTLSRCMTKHNLAELKNNKAEELNIELEEIVNDEIENNIMLNNQLLDCRKMAITLQNYIIKRIANNEQIDSSIASALKTSLETIAKIESLKIKKQEEFGNDLLENDFTLENLIEDIDNYEELQEKRKTEGKSKFKV